MGTRSLTHIKNEERRTLLTIYRQSDGYLSGMGRDLKEILGDMKLGNGISGTPEKFANGMGCAAAQILTALKGDRVGSVYVHVADDSDCGEEFIYTITPMGQTFNIKVENVYTDGGVIYDGPIGKLDPDYDYTQDYDDEIGDIVFE